MEYHHLLEAAGIIVSGVLFYSLASTWFASDKRPGRAITLGLAFGSLAVVLMISRIQIAEDLFIDARVIPVALVGLFEGWWPGLIAALMAAAYRAWLGGGGATAGVATVLGAAAAAALVHRWAGGAPRVRVRHSLVLAAVTFLVIFGGFALIPGRGPVLFARVWPSYLVMTLVGIPTLALLLQSIVERRGLMEERERFRAILDEATDAIRIVDADTQRILDCNRADCELSERSREDMIGRDVRELWPGEPERRAPREAAQAEVRAHGFAWTLGLPYRTASGKTVPVDSTRRLVEYRGRRYEIVMYRDAGPRLANEEARREAASLRSVNLLAQAAAHEINNPLAVIAGYLQLLEGRLAPQTEEGDWARTCSHAAIRIREAVARLSRIVRIESAQPAPSAPALLDTERSTAKPHGDTGR